MHIDIIEDAMWLSPSPTTLQQASMTAVQILMVHAPHCWLTDLQRKTTSQHSEMLVQMRESEKRKGSKRKGHMDDDTERHAMPSNRKPAKQGRR